MGFWGKLFKTSKNADKRTQVEDYYRVEVTAKSHPKRSTEQIGWGKIEEIMLVNTSEVPFLPDVWLILTGNEKDVQFPKDRKGLNRCMILFQNTKGLALRMF